MEQALVTQEITGQTRVAVVLASLDPDVAARVMEELDPHVMTRAAECIRNLGVVPGKTYRRAISESFQELQAYGEAVHGTDSMAVGLLSKVVGEQRAASMLEVGQMAGDRFGALACRSPEQIAKLLQSESASVLAVVMRFLPPQLASETLARFDEATRAKAILQMATANLPPERVIDQIEKQLVSRLPAAGKSQQDDSARIESLVSIMQRSPKEIADAMIEELSKENPKLADLVRDRMFVFEDIVRLEDSAIRRIMQELDNGVLGVALRKASDAVSERFFGNMSKRAAEGLREEMSFAGKVPYSEVLSKQKEIVQVARTLAEQGEIKISSGDEEYV